jgi:hypothetical protein
MGKNPCENNDTQFKKEFITPVTDLKDGSKWKWYKTWGGEILIPGNVYKVKDEFCVYAGDFNSKKEAPIAFCCYTIGDELKVRHVAIDSQVELPLKERRRKSDDDRPIDNTIKDADNTLMILIKTAVQFKNITRGDFRQLYPNLSDMNNILRCIEKGDNLSWGRFTDLIDKLNISYDLSIFNEDDQIIHKT